MVSSKESKMKWTKILDSINSELELVKAITDELSSIKIQSPNSKQQPAAKTQQKRTAKATNTKSRNGNSDEGKENQNQNPEEVAKNLASDYNDEPEDKEEPEPDP